MFLGACTSPPQSADGESAPAEDSDAAAPEDMPEGLEADAPDRNPYLRQTRNVDPEAETLFDEAVDAMKQGQWRRARDLLTRITDDWPELSGPHLNLGIVFLELEETGRAEESFQRAVERNSLNLEAHNRLALMARRKGDFEAAEQHYLNALAQWPKHPASHRNLGILYDLYMGEPEKALRHFEIYQYLNDDEDTQLRAWIADLARRLES